MNSGQKGRKAKHSASGILQFAWLAIPIFLAVIGVLWQADVKIVLEPPYLLPLLNFFFCTAVSIFVAYLAGISFSRNASVTVLMLGSGMLFFGTVSLIAAVAIQLGHINIGITVYNTGVLFSGICHVLAAAALVVESRVSRHAILTLSATYALVLTVTGLLTYAAAKGLTPVFFVQGIGPTPLRQAVTGTAIGVHVVSGIIIALVSGRFHWLFGRWYALSLLMIAIGLFGILIISHVGSPLGWSGRAAQYVGGVYMLVAVLAAAREGGEWDAALQSALKESQERYRILAEATFEGIVISEEDVIVDANEQFRRMLGYSESELIGKRIADLIPDKDREWFLDYILSGRDMAGKHTMLKNDGTLIFVESHGRTISRNGRQIRYSAIRDISDRKKSEEALMASEQRLKASLAEKEVLLKEIHHRVKNNMQVISSLVALQADQIKDDSLSNVLREVTDRVRSMAMVHEKLYQSDDLARVDFADYTQSLVNYLWRSYANLAPGVRLQLDLSPVLLPVNLAVPCGLIVNELFSNALKHAFRGRDGGQVNVALHGNSNGKVQLSVRDNGIGLPSEIDWQQSPSLGLSLVQTLAIQLHAAVQVTNAEGTKFKITFENQT